MLLTRAFLAPLAFLAVSFAYADNAPLKLEGDLRGEAIEARSKIIELLEYRLYASEMTKALKAQVKKGIPLSAEQLELVHENVTRRDEVKTELLALIDPYLDLANHPDRVKTQTDFFHYLKTLAIGYTLSDNYQDFVEAIQNTSHLRHISNEENTSYGKKKNLLRKSVRQFYSVKYHRPTRRGARHFSELNDELVQSVDQDIELQFFWVIIEESATFNYLSTQSSIGGFTSDLGFFFKKVFGAKRILPDAVHSSLEGTLFGISKLFGNTIGKFQSRNGLFFESDKAAARIRAQLQPGDILLEKTPFRKTDDFIPGYWGHNAIWLGTESDLRRLGLWDDPKIQPIADRIKAGQSIIEALRPGVTTNTVEHFLDIDSIAVLRKKNITTEEQQGIILRAAGQYGKKYDFGFDVETQDKLVCSELIFMSYLGEPFRLDKILGRYTINPDSIAEQALGGNFEIIMLGREGDFLTGDLEKEMEQLLKNDERN
jgi:hypothetical protein